MVVCNTLSSQDVNLALMLARGCDIETRGGICYISSHNSNEASVFTSAIRLFFNVEVELLGWDTVEIRDVVLNREPKLVIVSVPSSCPHESGVNSGKEMFEVVSMEFPGAPILWIISDKNDIPGFIPSDSKFFQLMETETEGVRSVLVELIRVVSWMTSITPTITL